ncbi:bifunctional indole-3-glycerol-phosphate synthase TrpC/phosphoribosylanthranilate isomerase TrpF [Alteromonas facilis]|uniref:bifunctional indole-3-glycerol-phosphate synthase TrpC/phosphoribosylanthranilate isomerase TrpF n=1 Tax=Alteromonas facilis TaxID=2048004 RepID=UPI000C2953D3|nr:bifunctional indole-3-glycerol-phosphate synthase TrpC/phosphoribosylanthranilate isomerase TrpF [Alteromonas facilis]
MSNVLAQIVADKREEVALRKVEFPLAEFQSQLAPTEKSFYDALAAPNASFILECKKASPSKGLIRKSFDLDEILAAYTPYAACISVLTDEKYFQGTFDYLAYVTARVTQPVINKDFFVDEYQVHLARYHGADAILLMLSVLNDAEYTALANIATHYHMAVLTEVSNEEEMQRAIALKANIIGINNRNLRDLSTDLATTERLTPMLQNVQFPHVVISESGIYTHADVKRLSPLCDGFLVGSALMAQDDITRAVKSLLFANTKVCGITTVEAATYLTTSPANYAGLIFADKSKRKVSFEQATKIVAAAHNQYVGVFVDQPIDLIVEYAHQLSLAAVQLHGNETLADIRALKHKLPPTCEIWKAIGVDITSDSVKSLPVSLTHADDPMWSIVDKVLIDSKSGDQSGGTGRQFDWSLVKHMVHPERLILAGGISPNNVTAALATGVAMLDINSGVESAPGVKSLSKLNALYAHLRSY